VRWAANSVTIELRLTGPADGAAGKSNILNSHRQGTAERREDDNQPANVETSSPELQVTEDAKKLALAIAGAGLDKKAAGVEIIDVCGKVDYADLLVLMTGRSDRHVHAIAKGVQRDLKREHGTAPLSVEGMTASSWVLIDYNDVVVHVFQQQARLFYDLEGLWLDAGRVSVPDPPDRGGHQ